MKSLLLAPILSLLFATPILAHVNYSPTLSCISNDDITMVRVVKSDNKLQALVYHEGRFGEALNCFDNYQEEEGSEVYLYKCGTRGSDGVWDDTQSLFYIQRKNFNPPRFAYATYIGEHETKEMVCIR